MSSLKAKTKYLENIVKEWNETAEEIWFKQGVREGTQKLLVNVLSDQRFIGRVANISSFGIESAVPLALMAESDHQVAEAFAAVNQPYTRVTHIFVNTGFLFEETLKYRDTLAQQLRLNTLRTVTLTPEELAQISPPVKCCGDFKVAALDRELQDFDIWFSGRKRYQEGRENVPSFEVADYKIKVNPMAFWSEAQVDKERESRGLARHPLQQKGYGSVGCETCTLPGPRRNGRGNKECGIHLDRNQPKTMVLS